MVIPISVINFKNKVDMLHVRLTEQNRRSVDVDAFANSTACCDLE